MSNDLVVRKVNVLGVFQMSIANPEQFGAPLNQDYMEQEEEWEREGLLDPAWEKQQRKVGAKICRVRILVAKNAAVFREKHFLSKLSITINICISHP